MIKIWSDGDYQDITEEQFREQLGVEAEATPSEPTAEERLSALEAAVADLALQNLPAEVKADA